MNSVIILGKYDSIVEIIECHCKKDSVSHLQDPDSCIL